MVVALASGAHGWLALAERLYRMFFPRAPQGGANMATYAVIAALLAIGCWLTMMSRPAGGQRESGDR